MAATASAVVIRAVEATAEEDIHQTAEAATETAAVAMASAEATVTTPKAEREDLHLTDRAVLLTGTGRLTDREEAMAATTTMEARGDHPTVALHSARVVLPTGTGVLRTEKKLWQQLRGRGEKIVIRTEPSFIRRGPSILWTEKKLRRQPGRRREKVVIFKKTGRRPRIRP